MGSKIFYLIAVTFYFVTWYGLSHMPLDKYKKDGIDGLYRLRGLSNRFLTNWNFFLQTSYFVMRLLVSLYEIFASAKSARKFMKPYIDLLFVNILLPLSLFVSVGFWTLYNHDRELVFPKVIDLVMPSWINHSIHTLIVPVIFIEAYLNPRKSPPMLASIYTWIGFFFAYAICLFGTYFEKGLWVYPIFAKVNVIGRIGLIFGFGLFSFVFLLIARYINNMFWGLRGSTMTSQIKRKSK